MAGDSPSHLVRSDSAAASPDAILDLCDGLLEEVGRRRHLFSWLRTPGAATGAATGEWLPVDGYYPARRVVVMCGQEGEHDGLIEGQIPAHGLRLLRVVPDELGSVPEVGLRERIAALELPPREIYDRSVGAPAMRESAISRMSASLVQATAPPPRQRARPTPRGAQAAAAARAEPSLAVGVVVGVALTIALGIELFVGVGEIALGSTPHWLLAFGFALDAVARALGTVAGERAGRLDWSLWSMIGGSPAVAAFTLFRQEGRMTTEPGPIAGLTSLAAMTMIGVWIVGSLLGL